MNSSAAIGSFLKPETDVVNRFVSSLLENCLTSKLNDFVSVHNAISLYTMQMFTFVTGHRAVSDPFCYLSAFDLKNNLVLIEDKVVSFTHQARLTWLPSLAIAQLQNYLTHLRNLARIVHLENPRLANDILSIIFSPTSPAMPMFFCLDRGNDGIIWNRYQPSSIKAALGEHWILPLNSNRHILSTWLRENGCMAEVVDAQLGHIEAGCSPFSRRSVLEPNAVGKKIIPFLEAYLVTQGWAAVVGFKASNRAPVINFDSALIGKNNTVSFGPQIRAINRQKIWQQDAKAVADLMTAEFGEKWLNPKKFKEVYVAYDTVNRLRDRLIQDSPDGRVLVRLSFLRRYLIRLKLAGWEIKVPGRLVLGKWEESSFDSTSLADYQKIERVRNQFATYLSSRVGAIADDERRVAEILISAVLFGANTSLPFLSALGTGFKERIFLTKDQVYVDISCSINGPIRRWVPDELTLALILGYSRNSGENLEALSEVSVCEHMRYILNAVGAPVPKKNSKKQSISQLLEPLLKPVKFFWRFRLPGVLHGYAEGEVSCASVPLSNWIRLLNGEAGTVEPQSSFVSSKAQNISCDDIYTIHNISSNKITYRQAKECWSEITAILGATHQDKKRVSAKIDSGNADSRSNARKKRIVSKISGFLNDNSKNIPPIAALVASWISHLCSNGSSHGFALRANSVAAYGRSIGDKLIALAYQYDFLSISDVLVEDVYRNLLETVSNQNRSYVAARLKEFHSFLISTYAMPDVDWSEIIESDLQEVDAVDAGVVTLEQYQKALESLLNLPDCSERDRLLHSMILFLAYRFGLRTGEIFRLTISDIMLYDREMVVYVRNSIYGETKSDNGIRQLPLIGGLSDIEFAVVSRWFGHVDTYADDDSLATFLPKLSSRREQVDRSVCVRTVLEVLRTVTGDSQTRLRHLRHTCATRLFLAMILDDVSSGIIENIYRSLWGDVIPKDVRMQLIGTSSLTRRGLYAMSLYMGHASPDVTHRHYVHLADIVLHKWLGEYSVDIDNQALSYAFQTTYENIRKLKSRCKAEFFQPYLIDHFIRSVEIEVPVLRHQYLQNTCETSMQQQKQLLLSPDDVDRILCIATMRKSYDSIEGISDRFLTTDHVIISTLTYASVIQERTGFNDYAIADTNPEDSWVDQKLSRYESLEKESVRARRFLSKVNLGSISKEQLKGVIDIWTDAYHPVSTALLIRKRSELICLLDALKALGIHNQDFEVIIPVPNNEHQLNIWSAIESELVLKGFNVYQKSRLPLSASKQSSENRLGLILRASDSHGLGYQRTLNRVLFVTAVWMRINFEA